MSLGVHHIDISLENIPGKLDDIKTKRLVEHSAGNGINGGHTPKINWAELATFIRAAASTDDEEAFLANIESFVLPTKADVLSVSSNSTFVEGIIKNVNKQIVYLYKGTRGDIDTYLASDDDNYIDYG